MKSTKDSFIPSKLGHKKEFSNRWPIFSSQLNLLQAFIANLHELEGTALNNAFQTILWSSKIDFIINILTEY